MENNRYSPQYPLTFKVIEPTKYDKVLRTLIIFSGLGYSITFRNYELKDIPIWPVIIIAVLIILFFLVPFLIIHLKKHYKEIGKLVMYDNRVELKTEIKVENIVLNQNKVYANISEYSDEGPHSQRESFLNLFAEAGNTITFTNGSKQTKYYFFLDNQSHAKMMVRRFLEWKKSGIDCVWKVSDNVL